ncbi:hypothetical protein A73_80 [Escherichia phage A73]|uniref:Uncharacterized protein n=1 Tax=Escherichia phage A73 TaxID=3003819 RepID=A0AAE9VX64_9CAUD|nr:hypothetical protein A73_80 [Escherichia phage A73]WBF77877.1 hypothetical protein W70_63 [Escherichia phage W70]
MRTVNFEFTHFHKAIGKEVVVEAEVVMYKGIPDAESDWDAEDYLDIFSITVYEDGEEIALDIPYEVVYRCIEERVRDAQVSQAFDEETGGF